jgi:hypothetical protein
MSDSSQDKTVLDHIDGISVDGKVFDEPADEPGHRLPLERDGVPQFPSDAMRGAI